MTPKITSALLAGLTFCSTFAFGQGPAPGVAKAVKELQGTWRLVSEVSDGMRTENVPGKFEWVIKGNKVRDMVRGQELFSTTFKVFPERGHCAFNLMERDGTVATRAIYAVRGIRPPPPSTSTAARDQRTFSRVTGLLLCLPKEDREGAGVAEILKVLDKRFAGAMPRGAGK